MAKNTRVITCASYGGTGSSAITDLLKEFSNIKSMGDFEFAFLHEVDGVSDLQHYVVDDFHRLKTDEGLYRFLNLCYDLNYNQGYNKIIGNDKFYEISKKYVEDIQGVTWDGYWHMHRNRVSKLKRRIIYGPDEIKLRVYRQIIGKFNDRYKEFTPEFKKSTIRLANIPYDEFIKHTKKYTSDFVNLFTQNQEFDFIALDQLLPPTNLNRYTNYFNDIKVIVVDRDPRDLYVLNKVYWKEGWIPTEDVETYIKWFELLRKNIDSNSNVLRINFEDLIYKYEKTVEKIMNFIEIDKEKHEFKKQYFIPEVSIKNTKLWDKHKELNKEIEMISKKLNSYCYNL
ncbi:hypothetical protein [Paraclostridium bifermentans]|uniref:hypothetical protein n=1 Tax=Paraclostridium bifermentans TaxID=1490 RepID=UPI00359C2F40